MILSRQNIITNHSLQRKRFNVQSVPDLRMNKLLNTLFVRLRNLVHFSLQMRRRKANFPTRYQRRR
uniref:Uncharacterized protein n=1 Tax=Arundo donax TaxID=35708 RepID=A0A0A9GVV0_ARUDO